MIDISKQSARLHRDITQSTLHRIAGVGHMVHQTATTAVMVAIDEAAGSELRKASAFVVVRHHLGAAWLHRQSRLGSVESQLSTSSMAPSSAATCSTIATKSSSVPKPFVWTADPKRVLAAVKRGKQTLESIP